MDPLVVQYVDEALRMLDRIATALKRRDVVEVRQLAFRIRVAGEWQTGMYCINNLLEAGWVVLGVDSIAEEGVVGLILGRPRSVTP